MATAFRLHGRAVYELALRISDDSDVAEQVTVALFVGLWSFPDRVDLEAAGLRWFLLAECYRHVTASLPGRRETSVASSLAELAPMVLSPAVRRTVELALTGYTYKQIAATLGEPEAVVLHGLRSGLRQLREVVTDRSARE